MGVTKVSSELDALRRWAIVVPGHSRRGRITPTCRRLLDHAAELARLEQPSVVVLTGWRSEAEQMLAAWPGRRDVELVAEPTASITAQNASRSVPLLRARGTTDVTVVCAAVHAPRVRILFPSVLARAGIRCTVSVVKVTPTPAALAWELGGMVVVRRQRLAALAELELEHA